MSILDNQIEENLWENFKHKKFTAEEISDEYLINIIKFVSDGSGYYPYNEEDNVKKLIELAYKRKINLIDYLSPDEKGGLAYNYNMGIKDINHLSDL